MVHITKIITVSKNKKIFRQNRTNNEIYVNIRGTKTANYNKKGGCILSFIHTYIQVYSFCIIFIPTKAEQLKI